jgi:hypothetical protein
MAVSISRRQAIAGGGVLAASAVVAGLLGSRLGQGADDANPASQAPDEAESRVLAAACECILPTTSTPGASALAVPLFVSRAMADWCTPEQAQALKDGLRGLDKAAESQLGKAFDKLSPQQQDDLLSKAELAKPAAVPGASAPPFMPLLVDLATSGYFTSEVGSTKVLRYDPVPGEFHGCVPLKDIGAGWAT